MIKHIKRLLLAAVTLIVALVPILQAQTVSSQDLYAELLDNVTQAYQGIPSHAGQLSLGAKFDLIEEGNFGVNINGNYLLAPDPLALETEYDFSIDWGIANSGGVAPSSFSTTVAMKSILLDGILFTFDGFSWTATDVASDIADFEYNTGEISQVMQEVQGLIDLGYYREAFLDFMEANLAIAEDDQTYQISFKPEADFYAYFEAINLNEEFVPRLLQDIEVLTGEELDSENRQEIESVDWAQILAESLNLIDELSLSFDKESFYLTQLKLVYDFTFAEIQEALAELDVEADITTDLASNFYLEIDYVADLLGESFEIEVPQEAIDQITEETTTEVTSWETTFEESTTEIDEGSEATIEETTGTDGNEEDTTGILDSYR